MSRATELAERHGATECTTTTFAGQRGFAFCREEVEAFYRAARSEALMEAAAHFQADHDETGGKIYAEVAKELSAMADMETQP